MKKKAFELGRHINKIIFAAALVAMALTAPAGSFFDLHAAENEDQGGDPIIFSVESTLKTNPRLMRLKQNRAAVQKDLRQAKGRYFPRVDLNAGFGTDSHSDIGTRNRNEENDFDSRTEASLKLVQPLYQGGEIDGSVEKQISKLESVEYRVYDNAESLSLDAIIAHLEVWRQRRLLALTEQNIRTHERILDHIDERQRAGAGSSADVVQTKGRLALTRSSRARISGALESARANYSRVVGRLPDKLRLPGNYRLLAPMNVEQVIKAAQGCNPKLAAFAADIAAARSEVDVQKSSFYPKLNLELSSTYEDQVESSTDYTHNNAAMVRGRWNLYNGGSDKAASDAAVSRRLELVSARTDEFQKIEEQIRDTWSQYQASGQQTKIFADAVHFNEKTRDAYQQQFIVGQRSLLDVLDSENEYFQSSGQLITARVNEIVAVYRLLALSGCLLKSLEVETESFELAAAPKNCCSKPTYTDSDGDGVPDGTDRCPDTKAGVKVDGDGCPLDSDMDGVPNDLDKCPNSKLGVRVDKNGCAPDSDGDGVINDMDQCPGTPRGVKVDDKGCPKLKPAATKSAQVTAEGTWIYKDIKYETNKWDLKSGSYGVLDEIANWLKSNPKLVVEVQGHSDITGKRDYNIALSQKRAQSVVTYLRHKGVDAARITPKGYGPDRPVGSNATAQGRAKNRRVEIKPLKW